MSDYFLNTPLPLSFGNIWKLNHIKANMYFTINLNNVSKKFHHFRKYCSGFIKKRIQHWRFPVNTMKIFKNDLVYRTTPEAPLKHLVKYFINPFVPNVPFLYPLKTSENLWFSNVFRGYQKRSVGVLMFSRDRKRVHLEWSS